MTDEKPTGALEIRVGEDEVVTARIATNDLDVFFQAKRDGSEYMRMTVTQGDKILDGEISNMTLSLFLTAITVLAELVPDNDKGSD